MCNPRSKLLGPVSFFVCLSVVVLSANLSAFAMSHKRCNDYANSRSWQGQQAVKFKCGFKGARWSTNYKTHYDWCRGVKSEALLKNEWTASAKALNKCKAKGKSYQGGPAGPGAPGPGAKGLGPAAKKQACNLYAHMATNHQHQNQNRRCGYKGARWSTNWQHHYGWCMKATVAKSSAESKARQNALKACKPKKPVKPAPMPAKPIPKAPGYPKPAPAYPGAVPGPVSPPQQPVAPAPAPGVVTPPPTGAAAVEWDTNRQGQDYRSFALDEPLPNICRQACTEEPQCQAWTFMKPGIEGPQAKCWLKSGVPQKIQDACCVSGVKMSAPPTAGGLAAGSKTFTDPSVEGYRVDWCVTLGVGCGEPAANAFCRLQGFTRSTSHEVARHIGAQTPTRTLGAGEVCGAPECDGFKSITCAQ